MVAISLRADRAFAGYDRLPMQFGPDGTPGWTAPRRIALAFSPVLSVLILLPTLWAAPDMPGILAFAGACLIGGHLFHLFLIRRSLRG